MLHRESQVFFPSSTVSAIAYVFYYMTATHFPNLLPFYISDAAQDYAKSRWPLSAQACAIMNGTLRGCYYYVFQFKRPWGKLII